LFARFIGSEVPNEASYLCRQRLIENIGLKMRNASCDPELVIALNGRHAIRILTDHRTARRVNGMPLILAIAGRRMQRQQQPPREPAAHVIERPLDVAS
jgi:hypothetical protein